MPWNPWLEQKGTVYGSLEFLPRSGQHKDTDHKPAPKVFNLWIFLSVFGGGVVSVFLLLGVLGVLAMKWTIPSDQVSYRSKLDKPQATAAVKSAQDQLSDETSITQDEFQVVKGKLHEFFSLAELNKVRQPLVITERELNAFLKHDTRLGVLHDTISARIKNGRIITSFDIRLGRISLLGNQDARLSGVGTFRIGMYDHQLKVGIDSLNVNSNSLYRWMQVAHNMGVKDLAKTGLKRITNIPLRMLGKKGFPSGKFSSEVLATFDIAKDSTGDVFRSVDYKGKGALNWLAEPVQLFTLNELFDVHSRLRDLVRSLERVEVGKDVIKLYPRSGL